jgi:hypothetical protein
LVVYLSGNLPGVLLLTLIAGGWFSTFIAIASLPSLLDIYLSLMDEYTVIVVKLVAGFLSAFAVYVLFYHAIAG